MKILKVTFGIILVSIKFAYSICETSEKNVKSKIEKSFNVKVEHIYKKDQLFEVIINNGKKSFPVYTDCQIKYVFVGEVIEVETKKNITRSTLVKIKAQSNKNKEKELLSLLSQKQLNKISYALQGNLNHISVVSIDSFPEKTIKFGPKDAKKHIYVISDPLCPFCSKLHSNIKKLMIRRRDFNVSVIFYPLQIHPHSKEVSSAILCYEKPSMLDFIFEAKNNYSAVKKFSSMACSKGFKILEKHVNFAKNLGVNGTPTILIPVKNNLSIKISGALSINMLEGLMDAIYQ